MQVVDVLRDQQKLALPTIFQLGQGQMPCIRRDGRITQLGATHVVEALYQRRITGEAFGRGYLFDAVVFPEAVSGAEGANAALGGDTGAGENDDIGLGHAGSEAGALLQL